MILCFSDLHGIFCAHLLSKAFANNKINSNTQQKKLYLRSGFLYMSTTNKSSRVVNLSRYEFSLRYYIITVTTSTQINTHKQLFALILVAVQSRILSLFTIVGMFCSTPHRCVIKCYKKK